MSDTLDAALADIAATTGLVFTHTTFGARRSGHLAYTHTRDAVVIIDDNWQALTDNGAGVFVPSNLRRPPVHPIVIVVYKDGDITRLPAHGGEYPPRRHRCASPPARPGPRTGRPRPPGVRPLPRL